MAAPSSDPGPPSSAVLLDIYRRATLVRQCDDRFQSVIRAGRLAAPYYCPRGQEIVAAAMSAALTDEDYVVTIYRGLHDQLCKGVPLKELWAEYAGRATGSCKGKGGPMHITHPATGVVVTTGIVGSGMPIANGLGLASQVNGDGRIAVSNFGDGASNIGAFHEALNLASVWKLPVVFLCQNNEFAEHTSYAKGTSVASVADRASSYSMPGVSVDGNDPVAMYEAARAAVNRARAGEGPTLIEARTFRLRGHVFGDPGHYIPKARMEQAEKDDPVPRFRAWLLSEGVCDSAVLEAIEARIAQELDEAVEFAFNSPYPDVIELRRDVFAKELV